MDPRLVAAIGMIAIGAVTSIVVYVMALRRATPGPQRRAVRDGSLSFALAVCTFMGVAPLLDTQHTWVLVLPLIGVWRALHMLHGLGVSPSSEPGAASDGGA